MEYESGKETAEVTERRQNSTAKKSVWITKSKMMVMETLLLLPFIQREKRGLLSRGDRPTFRRVGTTDSLL